MNVVDGGIGLGGWANVLLYKYLGRDRIDVLENGKIRFSQGSALNDPYEQKPNSEDLKEAFARVRREDWKGVKSLYKTYLGRGVLGRDVRTSVRKLRKSDPARFEAFLHDLVREYTDRQIDRVTRAEYDSSMLVLSLSKTRDNQLMWSHYADSHTGFTVGFDPDVLTDYLVRHHKASLPFNVTYGEKRYRVSKDSLKIERTPGVVREDGKLHYSVSFRFDFEFEAFSTKSMDWSYEHEVRYFARSGDGELKPGGERAEFPIFLYGFPAEAVREIILGSNADNEFIDRVIRLQAQHYPNAELLRAFPDPDTFVMQVIPLAESHPAARIGKLLRKHRLIGEDSVFWSGRSDPDSAEQ